MISKLLITRQSTLPLRSDKLTLSRVCGVIRTSETSMIRDIEFAESNEIESRAREVQLIINIVEPDPEYQPTFVSDEACFYDITGTDEKAVEANLRHYFKGELPAQLSTPVWQFIEIVKRRYPGWPENWPPEH